MPYALRFSRGIVSVRHFMRWKCQIGRKILQNRHLGDGTGTECDRNCKRVWMLRLNRKALQADEIGTAEFVGCFWK